MIILHDTFLFEGPFGDDMTEGFKSIAESINKEEGFIWKFGLKTDKLKKPEEHMLLII